MVRRIGGLVVLILVGGALLAADDKKPTKKEEGIKGTVVKVDAAKNTLTVKTDSGTKTYTLTDDAKYIGPRGGVSDAGIKDDRLAVGNEVRIVLAGNNKSVKEVHLPYRKRDAKGKTSTDKKTTDK